MPPRRSLPVAAAIAPVETLTAPPPLSPLIQRLRTDWRWAGISQFVWTFSDAFGLLDWDIEALEADLDRDEMSMAPDLIAKMLYALTYNRQINRHNAFDNFRKQYAKRAPDNLVLGTEEEPRDWTSLDIGQKVGILWDLCEWQMADPARFRALLKSEEESNQWRIEPVGWDKEGNTYFLFDDNRLWVQRLRPAPPQPAKKTSQKVKRSLNKRPRPNPEDEEDVDLPRSTPKAKPKPKAKAKSAKAKKLAPSPDDLTPPPPSPPAEETPLSGRRKRTQVSFFGNPISVVEALRRGGPRAPPAADTPSGSKITRSSSRAGLAAEPTTSTPSRSSTSASTKVAPSPATLSRGTRASRRNREIEEEWQPIPAEWLEPELGVVKSGEIDEGEKTDGSKAKAVEEDESELSSLTDEGEAMQVESAATRNGDEEVEKDVEEEEKTEDVNVEDPIVEGDKDAQQGGEGEDVNMEENPAPAKSDNGEKSKEAKVDPEASEAKEDLAEKVEEAGDVEIKDVAADVKPEEETKAAKDVKTESVVKPEEEVEETDEVKLAAKEDAIVPDGFIEWEAVAVTLYDWRTFPETFAKSRDPDEKALYALLTEAVGPTVISALVAKEQERLKQEAINNRKRSSRIATKELAKEEILRRQIAEREMEERMDKSRSEEKAKLKAEATLVTQEKAREDRVKEREERIAAREVALAQKAEEEQRIKDKADRARIRRQRRREGETVDTSEESEGEGSIKPKRSRVSTPVTGQKRQKKAGGKRKAEEGWELACEICRKTGWNLDDDDEDVVSCDDCGRWQHTGCHDKQDASEGRPKRDWETVDFKCKECRRKAARKRQRLSHEPRSSPLAQAPQSYPHSHHQQQQHHHYQYVNGHANGIHPAASFYPSSNGQHQPSPAQMSAMGQPRQSYPPSHPDQVYGALTRQTPSVLQPPSHSQQRPIAGYPAHYHPQQMQSHPQQRSAQPPHPGYPQHQHSSQYPPQVYRPAMPQQYIPSHPQQQQQHPMMQAQQPRGGPPQSYPGGSGVQYAPRPVYEYPPHQAMPASQAPPARRSSIPSAPPQSISALLDGPPNPQKSAPTTASMSIRPNGHSYAPAPPTSARPGAIPSRPPQMAPNYPEQPFGRGPYTQSSQPVYPQRTVQPVQPSQGLASHSRPSPSPPVYQSGPQHQNTPLPPSVGTVQTNLSAPVGQK